MSCSLALQVKHLLIVSPLSTVPSAYLQNYSSFHVSTGILSVVTDWQFLFWLSVPLVISRKFLEYEAAALTWLGTAFSFARAIISCGKGSCCCCLMEIDVWCRENSWSAHLCSCAGTVSCCYIKQLCIFQGVKWKKSCLFSIKLQIYIFFCNHDSNGDDYRE